MKKFISILKWPNQDRPREKLLKHGPDKLSDSELIAILLDTGTKGISAVDLARELLNKFGSIRELAYLSFNECLQIKGIKRTKYAKICACFEIARRYSEEKTFIKHKKIKTSKDVFEILFDRMKDLKKEVFKIIVLNSKNEVKNIIDIAQGTVNYANPIIREILKTSLDNYAVSIICVHNHPSGDPRPSKEDINFAQKLNSAAKPIGIALLDHIIIGNNTYYSFNDNENKKSL